MRQLIGPFHQLLTMTDIPVKGPVRNDQLRIIDRAGIITENGIISEINNFEVLARSESNVYHLEEKVVGFPGFIDVHTHLIWSGSRHLDFERRNSGMTYQDILKEGGGIHDTVAKTRSASEAELASTLSARIQRHVAGGVTTIEVKTGYGLTQESEMKLLRCIRNVDAQQDVDLVPTFLGAHVCPPQTKKEEYLDHLIHDVMPLIIGENLCNRVDIFVEEEAFGIDLARKYLKSARDLGFDLTVHAGQFSPDGVLVAVELGAVSADHLESIGSTDIELLAKSPTMAVALPGASLGLGMKMTPMRKILDAGGGGVIATDWNPGSAPMGDLLTQSAILATYEKLTAAEVFAGITCRAATALRLQDRGILSSGYMADIVSFQTHDFREILYHQGQLMPNNIWKKGKIL